MRPPTIGASTKARIHLPAPSPKSPTSAGPNDRAGLKAPPLTRPKMNSARPSAPPIASPDQAASPRGLTATPQIVQTRMNAPIISAAKPIDTLPSANELVRPGAP